MTRIDAIATDRPLTPNEQRALRGLAGMMIPASAEYGLPGADDDAIFGDILTTLVRSAASVREALQLLDTLAGRPFGEIDASAQRDAAELFRASGSPLVQTVVTLVVQSYYRDDRVMRSLGMEPRPPFPRGFELEEGDWSLLDPVRARPKMYRKV